ncbi:MAG TPA: alkyl hydroperoxide reductase, partial [Chloroflexota bacterium]|nr:alkyl hydroperoxide reductase [Chloroflexota bacterium]
PGASDVTPPGSHEDRHDDRGLLFIAMAGTHQIWAMDVAAGTIVPYAGTGREALVDGPRQEACFAQPSGLSLDASSGRLFVADSETSAIRVIDVHSGNVKTLVGAGLFDFGDVDGSPEVARLQHPLGVAFWGEDPDGESLLVADTYNHRIKRLDLQRVDVRTFAGTGAPAGFGDGAVEHARFSEPSGIVVARQYAFVADTNNHRVRAVDLHSMQVTTLEIDESRHAHE